jgi:hypothetical protein
MLPAAKACITCALVQLLCFLQITTCSNYPATACKGRNSSPNGIGRSKVTPGQQQQQQQQLDRRRSSPQFSL